MDSSRRRTPNHSIRIIPEGANIIRSRFRVEPMCEQFTTPTLCDNLPIGRARLLSQSSTQHNKEPLPVEYIDLDPNRER